jgi:hypothetical protein
MNNMDNTVGRCMYMFSTVQKDRMPTVFALGDTRASFKQSWL